MEVHILTICGIKSEHVCYLLYFVAVLALFEYILVVVLFGIMHLL